MRAFGVKAAWTLALIAAALGGCARLAPKRPAASAGATPMLNGHPDFSGGWTVPVAQLPVTTTNGKVFIQFRTPPPGTQKRVVDEPSYKPELRAKVKMLSVKQAYFDPAFKGANPGVPRLGFPVKIAETANEVILFYQPQQGDDFRIVPIGPNRQHDPDADPSYMGDSIAHWEGGVLVVESVGFVPDTWMSINGGIHSDKMKVTERFTRSGDSLTWQATVDDPDMLTTPWRKAPVTRKLNNERFRETEPYVDVATPLLRTNARPGEGG